MFFFNLERAVQGIVFYALNREESWIVCVYPFNSHGTWNHCIKVRNMQKNHHITRNKENSSVCEKNVKNSNGRAQREYIPCASKTNTISNGCNYKAAPLPSPAPLISNLESCQKHLNLNTLMAAMPTLSFFKKKERGS